MFEYILRRPQVFVITFKPSRAFLPLFQSNEALFWNQLRESSEAKWFIL